MKKLICFILCIISLVSFFSACSKKEKEPETTKVTTTEAEKAIDLDLSLMSGTAVYSEVYNIMSAPESYIGKIIKIKGNFQIYHDNATNTNYYACVIPDATACCQQGLEFTWEDGNHDMSEYPEEGTDIEIVGTFRVYKDFEDDVYQYCELENATMTVLNENSN